MGAATSCKSDQDVDDHFEPSMICPNCTYVPPNSQDNRMALAYAHCPLCGTELTSRMDLNANTRAQMRSSMLSNASFATSSQEYQRASLSPGHVRSNTANAEMQAELAGLRGKQEEHERLVQRLKNENEALQQQVERYASEKGTMEAHLKYFKGEFDRLTTEEEMFHNKAKAYKTEKFELQDKTDELVHANARLAKQRDDMEADKKAIEQELKLLKERYNEVTINHEAIERMVKTTAAEKDEWEEKYNEMNEKFENAEKERAQAKVKLDRLEGELAGWNKEEVEEQLSALKKEKFDLDYQLEELRHENAKLQKQAERVAGELSEQSKEESRDIESKLEELSHVTKQKEILHEKVNEYEDEIKGLNESIAGLRKTKKTLSDELDDLQVEHDRLKKTKSRLDGDLVEMEEQVKAKDLEIGQMKVKSKATSDELFENEMKMEKLNREKKILEEKVTTVEDENRVLRTEKKENEDKLYDAEMQAGKFQREVDRWKEEVSVLAKKNAEITTKMEASETSLQEMTAEKEELRKEFNEVSDQLENERREQSKARIEIERLESELASWNRVETEAELANLKKEKLQLDLDIEDLKCENTKLQKANERAAGELEEVKVEDKTEELITMTKQKEILQKKVVEFEEEISSLSLSLGELKKVKSELTNNFDTLEFDHDRLKKAKVTVDEDFATLEENYRKKESEISELKIKSKVFEDEKFDMELQLDKERKKLSVMEEKMQIMEAFGGELKGLKDDVLEKDQKLFNSEVTIGRLELEVARLQEELEDVRKKDSEMSNQMKEYIMKAKEAEVEKDANDNILQAQLKRAHEEIAELREQVESAKSKDQKIQNLEVEKAELVMEAEKSAKIKEENAELLKLKEQFAGTDKGQLMEEIMNLKRQVDIGTKEYMALKHENMKLKSSDAFALRKSFLESPNDAGDEHFLKEDSHLDIDQQDKILGEFRTEIGRLRQLSKVKQIEGSVPPTPVSKQTTYTDDDEDFLAEIDDRHVPNLPADGGGAYLDLDRFTPSSTMEPVWDLPATIDSGHGHVDMDAPLPTGPS